MGHVEGTARSWSRVTWGWVVLDPGIGSTNTWCAYCKDMQGFINQLISMGTIWICLKLGSSGIARSTIYVHWRFIPLFSLSKRMYWDVLYISYSIYMYHRIIIQYIPIYFILYHHSFPASYSEHSNIFNSYHLIIWSGIYGTDSLGSPSRYNDMGNMVIQHEYNDQISHVNINTIVELYRFIYIYG